jgi:outer membrane protein OmpA-like peptidoglycan-associated protein
MKQDLNFLSITYPPMNALTRYILLSIALLFLLSSSLRAQENYRWNLSLHGGSSFFRGDVGQGLALPERLPWESPRAFALGLDLGYRPLDSWSFRLGAYYQQLQGNDRMTDPASEAYPRALNFQTELQSLSLGLRYHFDNGRLLKRGARFAPFLGLHLSGFQFQVNGDLFAENGERYYYWSDGSIRNLDQENPMASSAQVLEQDGEYETNLSELNTETDSGYDLLSWGVGLEAGLLFRITSRLDLRIKARWNQAFTDYLDDAAGTYRDSYDNALQAYAGNPGMVDTEARSFRGNPDGARDGWGSLTVGLGYRFGVKLNRFTPPRFYITLPEDALVTASPRDTTFPPRDTLPPTPRERVAKPQPDPADSLNPADSLVAVTEPSLVPGDSLTPVPEPLKASAPDSLDSPAAAPVELADSLASPPEAVAARPIADSLAPPPLNEQASKPVARSASDSAADPTYQGLIQRFDSLQRWLQTRQAPPAPTVVIQMDSLWAGRQPSQPQAQAQNSQEVTQLRNEVTSLRAQLQEMQNRLAGLSGQVAAQPAVQPQAGLGTTDSADRDYGQLLARMDQLQRSINAQAGQPAPSIDLNPVRTRLEAIERRLDLLTAGSAAQLLQGRGKSEPQEVVIKQEADTSLRQALDSLRLQLAQARTDSSGSRPDSLAMQQLRLMEAQGQQLQQLQGLMSQQEQQLSQLRAERDSLAQEARKQPKVEVRTDTLRQLRVDTLRVQPELMAISRTNLYFSKGSDKMYEADLPMLDNLARQLKAHPDLILYIRGFADNMSGSARVNLRLSEERAETVKAYLLNQGVPEERMLVQAKGDIKPAYGNSLDRRVELEVKVK